MNGGAVEPAREKLKLVYISEGHSVQKKHMVIC